MRLNLFWLVCWVILLAACDLQAGQVAPEEGDALPRQAPAATAISLPTLYPSATPLSTPLPTETVPPQPTQPPDTPVAFDQISVDLRYSIPGLGLDRTLQGNVAGHLEITDEATGQVVTRSNQPGILIELQQALPRLTLEEIPPECDLCPQLAYRLPLADEEATGWLTDIQMLASVENFTSVYLGPHFPAGTIVGLRRSATPYSVAHTVALTADNQLWGWTAVESEIDGPAPAGDPGALLAEAMASVDVEALSEAYAEDCPRREGFETLYLNNGGQTRQIQLACPELALPASLLPVYLQLDALAREAVGGEEISEPEPPVPLAALVHYSSGGGGGLTIFHNGEAVARDDVGTVVTATITSTQVISLTQPLLDSGALEVGAAALVTDTYSNTLFVRGPEQVYSLGWDETPPSEIADQIAALEELQEEVLAASEVEGPEQRETPAPTPRGTATP